MDLQEPPRRTPHHRSSGRVAFKYIHSVKWEGLTVTSHCTPAIVAMTTGLAPLPHQLGCGAGKVSGWWLLYNDTTASVGWGNLHLSDLIPSTAGQQPVQSITATAETKYRRENRVRKFKNLSSRLLLVLTDSGLTVAPCQLCFDRSQYNTGGSLLCRPSPASRIYFNSGQQFLLCLL